MNRSWILAILISLAMVGSAFAVVGSSNAITPQTGNVNLELFYVGPGGSNYLANSTTIVKVTNYAGTIIDSGTGNSPSFKLNYGNYYIDISPSFVVVPGIPYKAIANAVHVPLAVSSSTYTQKIYIPINETNPVTVDVSGMATSGGSATISFTTLSGFTFEQNTTSGGSFQATLPVGHFYVNTNYQSTQFSYQQSLSTGQTSISVVLSGTGISSVYGYVYDQNQNPINDINVVVYNTSSLTYSVHHFSTDSYTVYAKNWANKYLIINAPGYNSSIITSVTAGIQASLNLQKNSSNVYYNYSISNNLKWVNLSLTYKINDGTALPTFGNSTIGSLYMQEQLDQITSASEITSYLQNFAEQYTNDTIMVGGYNYNLTGTPSVTVKTTAFPSHSLVAFLNVTYRNDNVPTSLYSNNFNIKVNVLGTQNTPASLNYNYNITYNNTQIALSTSSVGVAYSRNTIIIPPQSSNTEVTLTMTSAVPPAMVDPSINLFWNGIVSNNYVLNYSLNNTVFLTPLNTNVWFNLSNAYFDPQKDYMGANFTWKLNGNPAGWGHNNSLTFTSQSVNTINITAISPSGVENYTQFYVYAFNGTPTLNYTVSVGGSTVDSGSVSTSQQISVTLPQSSPVSFSGYGSAMKVGSTGYYSTVGYLWGMPSYKSTSQNISYTFAYPSIKSGVGKQSGYINVTSVVGSYVNLTFSIYVNDTTPPSPVIQLTNLTGSVVSQPTAGVGTVFNSTGSTDPYYPTGLTYKWQVLYDNSTAAPESSTTYQIVGGALNGSYVILKFLTINPMIVSLNVTNSIGLSAVKDKPVSVVIDSPNIVVNSIYLAKNLTQGSAATIWVNVTNSGTENANDYTISLYVGGVFKTSHFYHYLNVSEYSNVSFTWTPTMSGHVTMQFRGNNSSEPAFLASIGSYTTTMSIGPPAYRTTLIIGVIIAIIVVVGLVYYRLSTRKTAIRKPKKTKTKTSGEQKKPVEKKK